jgi:hypothetical protein
MANDNSASKPQYWALEALRILTQETPVLQLVNKQFAPALARAGDQVNAYRPDKRVTRRKDGTDENTESDANQTAVPVVLDQYFFDAFIINDEEDALNIQELTRLHAIPAIDTIRTGISRAILGRVHAFLRQGSPEKRAGRLDSITKSNAADFILEAEEVLHDNLAPADGMKVAIVHHTANTKLMRSETFERMDARGSDGTVMTGRIGKVYNTNVVMSQDVNYAKTANADTENKAINNAAGYADGHATALTTDGGGTSYTVGEYVVVAGNDQPTFATAATSTTSVTLNEALKYAVVDDAPIKHYQKATNEATTRAAGYKKSMTFTHTAAKNLQEGQIISFGTGGSRHTYTVIEVSATTSTTTTVLLDRPLESSVASGADAFPGPGGSMNPVMHKDAIAFVSRPMKAKSGKGVQSAVVNVDGIGVRVQESDELKASGTRYVVDVLAGVSVLDEDLLCVMLG